MVSATVEIVPVKETKFLRETLTHEPLHSHNTIGITAFYWSASKNVLNYLSDLNYIWITQNKTSWRFTRAIGIKINSK